MLIGYARASMEKQAIDRQLDELAVAGVRQSDIYQEKITGTKRDRPELNQLLASLRQGDTVITVELSRMGRSTKDLLEIVDLIHRKGAHFRSLNETWLDTTTPQGQLKSFLFDKSFQVQRANIGCPRLDTRLGQILVKGRQMMWLYVVKLQMPQRFHSTIF